MKWYEFDRTTNAFNFVFELTIAEYDEIGVKMPVVSANKRGINDIGWASDAGLDEYDVPKIKLSGTLAKNPKDKNAIWQEIQANDEINKCVSALKIKNLDNKPVRIEIRAIFN